jgi:MoxR-like ATPase
VCWITISAPYPSEDSEHAAEAAKKYVRLGASPRAGQALISAAKVKALMNGRFNVSYSDINELALPVLRHRIKLTFEAAAERVSADDIVNMIVAELIDRCKISAEKPAVKATKAEAAANTEVANENDTDKDSKKRGLFGRK